MRGTVHPIEQESFAILRSRVDLSHLRPLSRAVTERVVHSSADLDYATDLVLDEDALEQGLKALRGGAPVVADVQMVAPPTQMARTMRSDEKRAPRTKPFRCARMEFLRIDCLSVRRRGFSRGFPYPGVEGGTGREAGEAP